MFHISMAGPRRSHSRSAWHAWHALALLRDDPAGIDARDRLTVGLICAGLLSAFVIDMAILYFSLFRP